MGSIGTDYCIPPTLVDVKGDAIGKYSRHGLCEGDCVNDDDCEEGLKCSERPKGFDPILGCEGFGKSNWDYCIPDSNNSVHNTQIG